MQLIVVINLINLLSAAYLGLGGNCKLPSDSNLVPVTPDLMNGGWAMSPDQQCSPGKWCPYACVPGMVMNQWDPNVGCTDGAKCATMNGGLFCSGSGNLEIPFPDRPLCVPGAGTVEVNNKLGGSVSACQTVFPGNEAMLISTVIGSGSSQVISVPKSTYWQGTSAHYYLNMKGSNQEQCKWGNSDKPVGNWAPMVLGANMDDKGTTFAMATINPLFKEQNFKEGSYTISLTCVGDSCGSPNCTVGKSDFGKTCIVSAGPGSKVVATLTD